MVGTSVKVIISVHRGKLMMGACMESEVAAQRKGTEVGSLAS